MSDGVTGTLAVAAFYLCGILNILMTVRTRRYRRARARGEVDGELGARFVVGPFGLIAEAWSRFIKWYGDVR